MGLNGEEVTIIIDHQGGAFFRGDAAKAGHPATKRGASDVNASQARGNTIPLAEDDRRTKCPHSTESSRDSSRSGRAPSLVIERQADLEGQVPQNNPEPAW